MSDMEDRTDWTDLFRLDFRRPDYLPQFLGFVCNELSEIDRRACNRNTSQIGEARFQLGVNKGRVDLFVQLIDDLSGRAPWRAHAIPLARLIAWDELAHRRDVRQHVRAHCAGYRQRAK